MSNNEENPMESFRKRFKSLYIGEEFKNMKEAAVTMKVSSGAISNGLNYGIIPKPTTLLNIADYFKCSLNFLLGRTDDEREIEKSSTTRTFMQSLDLLIASKQITYYKLAKDLHMERPVISAWKSSCCIPSLENLDLVSDYFGCSIDYLLGRTNLL